ncbi:protein FAR1-RELATED SEQUENCE 5-like [Pyrus communis]|uniref:protein FAR1-RELATED SEQUENCE 5-like n=1 Tax=Pyrus communis TaxID=23211 RepID=UPI0035BEE9FA
MVIKLNRSNGRFFVHEFEEQHNHALKKPECAHMLPSQRKISDSQAAELDLAEESGIPLWESYELMAKHVGGRESLGYTKVDQKNYLLPKRQRKMVYGEAGSLLRYFQSMSNKAPKTIFTDQDAAMMNAIPHVMPDTYHRLCLWHMMQNALKNVNCIFKGNSGGKALEWLKGIKKLRKKWAKAYVKMAWSAGMTATGISESFNGRLKEYLQSDYNVVQFVMHFERELDDQRYKEYQAEYNLCYKNAQVKVPAMMVKQAGDTYMKAIFEDFQEQYGESLDLRIKSTVDDGEDVVYTDFPPYGAFMERHVRRERDSNIICCSCRLFEIKGILCSHAIKILIEVMDTLEIPSQYILKRWTKKVRAKSIQDMHGKEIQVDPRLQQSSRFRSLCHAFTQISSRAAKSDETYEIARSYAHKLGKLTEDKLSLQINGKTEDEGEDSAPIMALNQSNDVPNLNNATVVQAKGLKKRETCRGRRRPKSCL